MRIIHVFSSGISNINGITNVIERLSMYQKKQGHDVCTIDIKKEKAIRLISEFKPEIVSFHGLYYFDYLRIALFLTTHCIPYVIQFHGGASSDNYRKSKLKKRIANLLFFNRFIKNASSTVYLNDGEYNKSIFKCFNLPFFIVPNGIDTRESVSLSNHRGISFLFFSRIDIYGKGLDVLAEVIKRLSNNNLSESIRFVFYGHIYDSSKNYFNQFSGNFVEYKGTVFGKDKDDAFEASDIVILPSRSEGMPLTILEAFSYGRPVIVTPETNMGDLVSEHNLGWVTNLTISDLYSTIVRAINEFKKDREGYLLRCFEISKSFSWDSIANTTIREYDSIVKRYHSNRPN